MLIILLSSFWYENLKVLVALKLFSFRKTWLIVKINGGKLGRKRGLVRHHILQPDHLRK